MTWIDINTYHSPVGPIEITVTKDAVTGLKFNSTANSQKGPVNEVMKQCFIELDEYFDKKRIQFDIKTELTGSDFEIQVWKELQKIPYAKTISYKDLAKRLGDIKKVRAVGGANARNKIPILFPCHRVIGEDGSLTGFAGGLEIKSWLLQHEGAISEQLEIF
jgi:methylated-DNA-[protein]-cysteine S-methyltransferase